MKIKKPRKYPKSKVLTLDEAIHYDQNEVWTTKDMQYIHLHDLRDSHLENIVEAFKKYPSWRKDQQHFIHDEIKRRKIVKARKGKAGKLLFKEEEIPKGYTISIDIETSKFNEQLEFYKYGLKNFIESLSK